MVMFALLGMFFLITQYLQFALGYSPLRTGLSIAPVAAILLVIAPLSAVLARRFGTKPLVGGGLLIVALGLGLLSRTTVHGGYGGCLPAFLLVGLGVSLALAPSLDSIMGALPRKEAGVGSATSDTFLQIGGVLGVAVLGTLLAALYENQMTPLLAGRHIPAAISKLILGSLGGALAVAERAPAPLGSALASAAKQAFISGMDLGLIVAASVVGAADLIVLAVLPNRPRTQKNSLGRPSPHLNEPPKPG